MTGGGRRSGPPQATPVKRAAHLGIKKILVYHGLSFNVQKNGRKKVQKIIPAYVFSSSQQKKYNHILYSLYKI